MQGSTNMCSVRMPKVRSTGYRWCSDLFTRLAFLQDAYLLKAALERSKSNIVYKLHNTLFSECSIAFQTCSFLSGYPVHAQN